MGRGNRHCRAVLLRVQETTRALREIASVYRRQVDNRSAILRTVLPPFVVITTAGVLTVLCVTAIMLPMVNLLEGLSR